jgi:hypothetical protein
MKIKYRHHLDPDMVKVHDTDKAYENCHIRNNAGMTPAEWADFTDDKFKQDKDAGYILEYEVVDPVSMPPRLSLVKKVLFATLLENTFIGNAIDSYFKRHGWGLYIVSNGQREGYQVFFGKGIQVDNSYEWGFPHLYDELDVVNFGCEFFWKKVCTEDMEICPMCGEHIELGDAEEDGYGELSMYWTCKKCGHTGAAIIDTHNDNNFVRHEVD